jgi:hypothetical protein
MQVDVAACRQSDGEHDAGGVLSFAKESALHDESGVC